MRRLNEKGAVTALVAVMLVLIIVCVALVVDLGHIHNVKGQLQAAVDAAALAGARELDGASDQGTRVTNAANGTAGANKVDNALISNEIAAGNLTLSVELGGWNKVNLGDPILNPSDPDHQRYTPGATPFKAVRVTATRNVDPVFFFFAQDGIDVTADAIAVATPKVPVLPLAIITCIPADRMLESPGALPPAKVCGIADFSFDNDQEDTSAWSSLTFNANAQEIVELMSTEEGAVKFNKIVFGTGLNGTKGLENERVDPAASSFDPTYLGCPDSSVSFPNGFNIPCGLGRISDEDLAAPSQFVPKNNDPGILNSTPGAPTAGFDPLTDYGRNGGTLPRWYNLNGDDTSFDNDDHFTRVWSQDHILVPRQSDLDANDKLYPASPFFSRLEALANGTDKPYNDTRFVNHDNDPLGPGGYFVIDPQTQGVAGLAQKLDESLTFIPPYWPDFLRVVKHAGYPKVGVINGNAATVLQAFVNNENVSDGKNLMCTENDPLEGKKTLRINAPVIFAGACESWQALSGGSSEHDLRYVGMSKLLVTRVWTNQKDYDCGDGFVEWDSVEDTECDDSDFEPPLNGIAFSLPVSVSPSLKAIEGLTLVPVADDEEDKGSLLQVYLVE